MRSVLLVILIRISLLVAIAASAILVIEYQSFGDPTFCGVGSACAEVRNSPLSRDVLRTLGISLPQLGLAAYVFLLGASLMATARLHHILVAVLAGVGGACGVTLLVVQSFGIGVFCPWCVAVDISAVVAAAAAIALAVGSPRTRGAAGEEPPAWNAGNVVAAWTGAAVAAVALPFLWNEYRALPAPPPALAPLQVPGKITVIEFTDFECPHCRSLHPVLLTLKKTYGDRLDFTRKMVPLEFHRGALPAAHAYLCTPEEKREAMADALYRAPSVELTREGTITIAKQLGVDGAQFERCLEAPATKQALEKDRDLFSKLGTSGVPQTYVGGKVILGDNPEKLFRAVERAASASQAELPLPLLYVILGVLFAGAGVHTFRATWGRASGQNDPRAP